MKNKVANDKMQFRFTKAAGAITLSVLVYMFFSCSFGWFNTGSRVYATWDVPPRPVPVVSFDLYTQKAGTGPHIPGGEFTLDECVVLYVSMTSGDSPIENETIVFEITGPVSSDLNVSFSRTAITNASGIAYQIFSVQPIGDTQWIILGTWSVTAQVGLDQETYGDSLDFEVVSTSTIAHSACIYICSSATPYSRPR